MNGAGARRLLAIVAVFVLVVSLIAWHSHRTAAMRRAASKATAATATAAPRRSSNADDVATTQALERPSAPTIELIARDPLEAANAWQSRAWSVLYAQNRKEYGDDVARLLQLPYNEAWDELLARSKNGDIAAGAALMHIANICKLESTRGEHASDKIPPPSRGYKNLPDMWKPFVDRLGELHDEDHQRITHCEGVGDVLDLATAFFDSFFTADNPEAQVEIAATNEDAKQGIADLREILAAHDVPQGRAMLGGLLIHSDDAAERSEGRALLEALAPDNPYVATSLAHCLEHGCGGATPDPGAAREWFENASGVGDDLALSFLIELLAKNNDRAAAWAWSRYALDLALDGCFETSIPMYMQVASRARDEAQKKAILTPDEQNAGLAIGYAISGRWEKQARERLSCD